MTTNAMGTLNLGNNVPLIPFPCPEFQKNLGWIMFVKRVMIIPLVGGGKPGSIAAKGSEVYGALEYGPILASVQFRSGDTCSIDTLGLLVLPHVITVQCSPAEV